MNLNIKNAIIDKVQTLRDKSLKITLITRELPPEELAGMFLMLQQEVDISADVHDETDTKSPSQRLRGVLYRLWEDQYKSSYKEFEIFYRAKMDKIIESLKDKIN